jgi:hypothetical protein
MARIGSESGSTGPSNAQETLSFKAEGQERIELPSSDFIADAKMTREGDDLILQTPNGETAVIEGYFSADPAPLLQSADGATLTPNLVDAFSRSSMEFAANNSASDESPVGAVEEVKGNATVTRADGTVETVTIGTPIYQGDIVETDASGAVNIVFIDETSMAVSENARLAIDEYTFDPATESGTTNFSVLRGLFVFTSGLIGRDDPDDVSIDTPVGSIGIRGTVIAGEINPSGESTITVLEGAIVVTNGNMESVLSEQFQTVRLSGFDEPMHDMGVVPANDIGTRFNSIGDVNPSLFTTINDAAKEQGPTQQNQPSTNDQPVNEPQSQQEQTQETAPVADTAPPVAMPPSPMDTGIATLDGSSTGLPSQNTVTGQPSAAPPAPDNTSSSTSGTETPPPSTQSNTITATPPSPSVADNLPPPPPVNGGTATTPPAISFTGGVFTDITESNTVIGRLSSGLTGLTISSPHFTIVTDATGANVVLNSAGETALNNSLDVTQLGSFTITGQTADGQTITRTFGTTVVDAHDSNSRIDLNGSASAQKFAMISDTLNNNIGFTITSLGDVNNDGFDDFAFSNDTTGGGNNHIYRIYGGDGVLPSGNVVGYPGMNTLTNPTSPSGIDQTVIAGAGDFNGDGVEDYVIGQYQNGSFGNIAIVGGSTGASPGNITFTGSGSAGASLGYSVDGIGDFNNDGYADVVAGAPTSGTTGAAYLISGRSDWNTDINIASPGVNGAQTIIGDPSSSFGSSVTGIGDFNGDGFSDFAIGAPSENGNTGAVRLYYGNDANSATASGYMFYGDPGDALGEEMTGLGDINGDGRSDLMVAGAGNIGKIYFGMDGFAGVSDIELNISPSYTLTGGGSVGDFNGDGFDDFALSLGNSTSTHAYVVFGKDSWTGTIDLAFLKDPDNAMEIQYAGANNASGLEINSIGDINGDGYDDFAMGVPDANGGAAGNGGVAIVYGRNTGGVTDGAVTATADHQALVGTSTGNTLANGTAVNDYVDVSMRGGAGNDIFTLYNGGFREIDGGSQLSAGFDRILIKNNLDFTDIDFEKISGIEALQYGNANLTMTLTMENLFNLLKSSDTGSLRIDTSNTGSILNLDATSVTGTGAATTPGNTNIVNALNEMGNGAVHETTSDLAGYRQFSIGGYDLYITENVNMAVNVV